MVQRPDRSTFLLESTREIRIRSEPLGQNFDGHAPVELVVVGSIDFSHPAGANGRQYFVGA